MSHNVYKIKHTIAIPDPDMPQPRYHHVLFVETKPNGDGRIHQVNGDITTGMYYESHDEKGPEELESFHDKEFLGMVKAEDYPERIDDVLRALPPPPKQKKFNVKTMRTEQMKDDGTFYEAGELRAPMWKCTEWTANQAIPALYASGVLRK
jgi:hypothetical protein